MRVIQSTGSTANNFMLQGGDGTFDDGGIGTDSQNDGPARFFLGGHEFVLNADRDYVDNSTFRPKTHSRITSVSAATTFQDNAAFFGVHSDTLVGRICYPDISLSNDDAGGPLGWPISGVVDQNHLSLDFTTPTNADGTAFGGTAPTSLEAAGVTTGSQYRINISTPGAARTDSIVLDVFEDEDTPEDDSILARTIEGTITPSANALVASFRVEFLENVDLSATGMGSAPFYYERRSDINGSVHHRCLLATVTRSAAPLTTSDITNYNSDPLWNLSFSNLPPTGTGSFIDGSNGVESVGVNTGAGQFGGSSLKLDKVLLQMLGNVTDPQNQAFQNMGDYDDAAGATTAGSPGIGDADYGTSGGHVLLGTNDEQGSIRNRPVGDALSGTNQLLSILAHRGFGGDTNATSGQASEHVIAGTPMAAAGFGTAFPAPIVVGMTQQALSGQPIGTATFNTGIVGSGVFTDLATIQGAYELFSWVELSDINNFSVAYNFLNYSYAGGNLQVTYNFTSGATYTMRIFTAAIAKGPGAV